MKESTKNGYIAGGVLLLGGLFLIYIWLTSGRDGFVGLISLVATILGIGGIAKPDFIGQVLHHWMNQGHTKQKQHKPYKSPQNYTRKGDVYNIYNK